MMRRFTVTVGGRTREVEIEAVDPRRTRIVLDGRARTIDAVEIEAGAWSLLDGDDARIVTARVEGAPPSLRVDVGEALVPVEVAGADDSALAVGVHRTSSGSAGPSVLRAPMPGRVVKIHCRIGEAISPAQGLLVIEAMKMENEIRAPRPGTVREILCREGAAVEAGQALIALE